MVKDLTVGKPSSILWRFTLPLFISVIFQQFYNIADSIIVGNFATNGESALAAVGASYPITMIFMAIAMGSNVGCSVVISQLFGAKKYRQMKSAISTTLIASLALAGALTIVGLVFSPLMLKVISTPSDIMADSDIYLKIYIAGFIFIFLYNVSNGVFTALGDSKTPLYFLIGSSLGNIVLDYVFVALFHWDVAGVAWATFICQGVACMLALITMKKRLAYEEFQGKYVKFSPTLLKKVAAIAIPSILQQSFVSVGNLFIQNLINSFGTSVVAGYSAAIKINTFGITTFTTLGNAMSTYTAQNIGAGHNDRVREGHKVDCIMGIALSFIFFLICFFEGDLLVGAFIKDSSAYAIATGTEFLKIVAPFYMIIVFKLITDGVLRGSGAMTCFMIATFSDLIIRVGLAYILSVPFGVTGIWMSWPVGWVMGTALSVGFYARGLWKIRK